MKPAHTLYIFLTAICFGACTKSANPPATLQEQQADASPTKQLPESKAPALVTHPTSACRVESKYGRRRVVYKGNDWLYGPSSTGILDVLFSPGGRYIAFVAASGAGVDDWPGREEYGVVVIDCASGTRRGFFDAGKGGDLHWSSEDTFVYVLNNDKTVIDLSALPDDPGPWGDFFRAPSTESLQKLQQKAQDCAGENYVFDRSCAPRWEHVRKSYRLLENGSYWGLETALILFQNDFVGGGDAHDGLVLVGLYLEKEPDKFLTAVCNKSIGEAFLGSLVSSLPLDSVDDEKAQREHLRRRVNLLENSSVDCKRRHVAIHLLKESLENW